MMMSRSRPVLIIAIGAALIGAAVGYGRWRRAHTSQPPVMNDEVRRVRAELVDELKPVTLSNCEWARVGSANDGGYAMCANLLAGIETAYSYGIGGNDDWGCQISASYKVQVHQYDCFEPKYPPCGSGANMQLNVECVGPKTERVDGRAFDTIANQIARNGDTGTKMVMKIDIEGAEWQSILAAPDSVFDSIVQMPMELHGTDKQEVLDGIRKLKQHFHLVSVHFNNWNCSDDFAPFPNWAYQVLWVNKNVGVVGEPRAGSPTRESAIAPDNPKAPDCVTTIGK
jgi:hypothetical protein